MPDETTFFQRYVVAPRPLTSPSRRRPGLPVSPGVRFIVAHDTGNPGSTASGNVGYYERSRDELSASAHIFVDDREILECIPALSGPAEKAWHVRYNVETDDRLFGHDANDAAIGIEYCYGGRIDPDEAYRKYVWVIAFACHRFGLDPRHSVVGHFFLDPTRRTDPVSGLAHSRRTYEQLLRDVVTEYQQCLGATQPPPPSAPDATDEPARVTTRVRLNVRGGAPSTRAPVVQTLPVGTTVETTGSTHQGEPVNGNPTWYRTASGDWLWSGGVRVA